MTAEEIDRLVRDADAPSYGQRIGATVAGICQQPGPGRAQLRNPADDFREAGDRQAAIVHQQFSAGADELRPCQPGDLDRRRERAKLACEGARI